MTPLSQSVAAVLLRELGALRREVEAFSHEADVWALPPGIANSTGTLVLHLTGNLQHFVGARLGGSGYVRDRAREFAARDLPRAVLLQELDAASSVVRTVLPTLDDRTLGTSFPEVVGGQQIETADFLLHLCAHLSYHLGQVNYHRRLVTGVPTTVNALTLNELRTARPTAGA